MLEAIEVSKSYDNGLVQAVQAVSLSISSGEVVSLTGPSGCGKSTLLNLLGALDTPDSGTVLYDRRPIPHPSKADHYRARTTGFIFQLHNLVPVLTLRENVELPLYSRKDLSRTARQKQALETLEEVGLAHRADFLPVRVSGGERQRAAVARALVNAPALLLADEPTGSVDSENARYIMDAILTRSRENGMTTLLVTHDRDIAAQAGRILRMIDGKVSSQMSGID